MSYRSAERTNVKNTSSSLIMLVASIVWLKYFV